jgi:hypothetical protein
MKILSQELELYVNVNLGPHHPVQTDYGAQSSLLSNGYQGLFLGGKAAGE